MNTKRESTCKRLARTFLVGALIGTWTSAGAIGIPTRPLFLADDVPPNVFFALDDSGSMRWTILLRYESLDPADRRTLFRDESGVSPGARGPLFQFVDDLGRGGETIDFSPNDPEEDLWLCPGHNALAYNPNTTYTPWAGEDTNGNPFQNASITSARRNPYNPGSGSDNLLAIDGTSYATVYGLWVDADNDGEYDANECPSGDIAVAPFGDPDGFRGYGSRVPDGAFTDPRFVFVDTLSPAEQQNYANWFSYYRNREHVMKRAVSQLVSESVARMGLATLHNNSPVGTPVRDMSNASNKATLLDAVARISSRQSTPLRRLLENVGRYYNQKDGNSFNGLGFPSTVNSPILSQAQGGECGQNFTVLFSDGFWNGGNPSVGNEDGNDDTEFDGGPHADNVSNTLADVAMRYYEDDLSNLDNYVPTTPGIDDNDKQHMVTYTVAFGIDGTLDVETDVPADHEDSTAPPPWPTPVSGTATTVDDMVHAAFNGRGEFLSGRDSESLIQTLSDALISIGDRTGTASAVAATSQSIQTETLVFQGLFDTNGWNGDLFAIELLADGTIGDTVWTASSNMPTEATRSLYTWSDDGTPDGAVFEWADITPAEKTLIGSEAILDYTRGDRSMEAPMGAFRARDAFNASVAPLGDIIDSTPIAVTQEQISLPLEDLPEGDSGVFINYLQTEKASRQDMVYVGSNDGVMHGFRADTGVEVFGYVPRTLFPKLAALTHPQYNHDWYVDGGMDAADVYIGGDWTSVLVGSLGRGGKALFALDVGDPLNFDENDVLWEFTDPELGIYLGRPQIVRLNSPSGSPRWAAIVGNGYNSASHTAQLFVIDISTGNVIKRIDTGVGSAGNPNGLATPLVTDINRDLTVDAVYAGDLHGNMWKFDLGAEAIEDGVPATTPDTVADWGIAYKLYQAKSPTGANQPITTRPSIAANPNGGFVLLFGTGRYFAVGDDVIPAPPPVDTFYGIWDNLAGPALSGTPAVPSVVTRNSVVLQQQTILAEPTQTFGSNTETVRILSNNDVNYGLQSGWYLDLVSPPPTGAQGERLIADPVIFGDIILFNTFISSNDCALGGGTSPLMALDAVNGGEPLFTVFDLDQDQEFDTGDQVGGADTDGDGVPDSYSNPAGQIGARSVAPVTLVGMQQDGMAIALTTTLENAGAVGGEGGGNIETTVLNDPILTLGRQAWKQLR